MSTVFCLELKNKQHFRPARQDCPLSENEDSAKSKQSLYLHRAKQTGFSVCVNF